MATGCLSLYRIMFSLNVYFSTYVTLLAFHPSALDRPQPSRAEVACLLSFWQPSTAPRTSHHQSPSSPSLLLILSVQPTSASITDLAGNVCSHHIPPSIDTCPHHQPSLSSVFSLSNEAPRPPHSEKLCLQNNNAATATHPVIVFCSCPNSAPETTQLMRAALWPATWEKPRSAISMTCLKTFHSLTLNAHTNVHDYIAHLARLPDKVSTDEVQVSATLLSPHPHCSRNYLGSRA